MPEMWIVIPNWRDFQHYKDRTPKWIKNYTELMSDDAYLGLSAGRRGLLHGLWLEYALSRGSLALDADLSGTSPRLDLRLLNRRLGLHAKMRDLEALRDAGFITFSASAPLAKPEHPASPDKSREEKNPPTPLPGGHRRTSEERRTAKQAAKPPKYLAGVQPIWNTTPTADREKAVRVHLEGFTDDPAEVEEHLDHLRTQEAA